MINEQIIYTTGYTGKNIDDLTPLLKSINAVLVDVRFAPVSRHPKWMKENLQSILGKRYKHVPALGNRAYKEGKIAIQNVNLGLNTVLSFGINAILMCGCEELMQCHRFVIAQELRRRGIETRELESWKMIETTLF